MLVAEIMSISWCSFGYTRMNEYTTAPTSETKFWLELIISGVLRMIESGVSIYNYPGAIVREFFLKLFMWFWSSAKLETCDVAKGGCYH